jgi:hypothetical protein
MRGPRRKYIFTGLEPGTGLLHDGSECDGGEGEKEKEEHEPEKKFHAG